MRLLPEEDARSSLGASPDTAFRRRRGAGALVASWHGLDHERKRHESRDKARQRRAYRLPRAHRDRGHGARVPPVRTRRPGLRAGRREGRRPPPRGLRLRHREGQLRRRLRDARRVREQAQGRFATDRAPRDTDPRQVRASERGDLPPRRRSRPDEHAVREREPVRRRPRRRPCRLPRDGRFLRARLSGGRIGDEALDRPSRREVVPRARRRFPRLRAPTDGQRRRSRRLQPAAAGRRSRGRPQGARLRPHRPPERKRRDTHCDDLLLALPEERPPVGDDRGEPARSLRLGREDDRRADPPLRRSLRGGLVLRKPDA